MKLPRSRGCGFSTPSRKHELCFLRIRKHGVQFYLGIVRQCALSINFGVCGLRAWQNGWRFGADVFSACNGFFSCKVFEDVLRRENSFSFVSVMGGRMMLCVVVCRVEFA